MAGGSIGDLYYGLGLDDSEFNNKLKAIKAEKLTLNAQIDYASITQSIQRLSSMGKTLVINPVLDKDKVTRIQSQLDSIHNKLKQQYDVKIVISEADTKKSLDSIKKNVADTINELKKYDKIHINPIDRSAISAIRELVKELKFLESVLKRVDALNMRNVNQSAVAGARVAEIQARQASRASLDAQRLIIEQARAQRTLAGATANTTNAQRGLNQQFTLQGRMLSNLKTLATTYVSIFAVKSFIQNLAQVRGEFELQQVSLRAILRDAEAADKIFSQIKSFSVVSPFEFKDLVGYAKQLSAFQVPVDELFDTTKRLADVSAGLGVGMDRIILAYGQVRAASVLRGCLGFDTEIQTIKGIEKVQNIKIGDKLFTDASIPNNVIELIRGREQMYLIKQEGANYRVNENHILTLSRNSEIVDVCLKNIKDDYSEYLGVKFINGEYVTYPIEIVEDNIDDYYGFVLDGNKRFLLGDNTLTHNTELRQFTEAGIPLVDELAKKFSELEGRVVSAGDVFEKISNRMVSFEMVKDIFADLTNEGGMFYMMQEKQAESLKGKIANLADAYAIMLNSIGEANDGILKGGVEGIAALMQNWEKVWAILKGLIITYGAYKGVILAVAAAQKIQNLGEQIKLMLELRKSLGLATAAQQSFNSATKANPYILVASVIIGAISAIYSFASANNKAEEEANNASVALVKEQDRVNGLINKLKELTNVSGKSNEVTKERIKIYNELKNASADVAGQIHLEKTSLEELIKIQEEYNNKQSTKKQIQRFYISGGFDEAIKEVEEAGDNLISAQVKMEDNYIRFKDRFEKISERGIKVSGGTTENLTEKDVESLNKIYNSTKKGYEKQIDLMNWYAQQYRLSGEVINGVMSESTKKRRDLLDGMFDGVDKGFSDYRRAIGEVSRAETDYQKKLEQSVSTFKVSLEDKYGSTESWSEETKALIANLINSLETDDKFKLDIKIRLGVNVEQLKIDAVLRGWRKSVEDIAGEFYRSELANNETELLGVLEQAAKRYSELAEDKKKYDAIDFEGKNEKEITQIKDKVSAVNKEIEAQKALLEYYNQSLPTGKGGGKPKDPRIEVLENQIKLIEEAQKAYENLNKYMGKEKTGKSLVPIYQSVNFKADEKGNVDFAGQIQSQISKLTAISKEAGQKAQESFDKGVRGKKTQGLEDNVKESLDAISNQIESYKGKYDFYEQILGITKDKEKSIDIAFGVNFKGDIDIIKYLQDKIQSAVGKGIKLDLTTDIISKDFGEVFKGLKIPEEQKKDLQKFFDMLKKQFIDFQTEASKAKQSLDDMVSDLESKDFNLFGKGFELDISKIARDTANAYAEIDKREKEKTEELSKFKNDKDKKLYEVQLKRLRILGDKEKEIIKKQSQEKLNDLAGKVINEGLDDKGLKGIFDNLSEASFKQLNQLKKYFKEVGENGIVISTNEAEASLNKVKLSIDKLKGLTMDEIVLKINGTSLSDAEKQAISLYMQLKKGKLSAEEFDIALKKISTEKLGKTNEERLQKISNIATQAAQSLGQLGDSLYNLGESSGNESLMNAGDMISSIASFAQSAADITMGILSGNPADVIKGVFSIATQFIETEARHQKALAELTKAKVEMQREYNLLLLKQNLLFEEGINIFGTDQIGRAINAIAVYRDAISDFADEMQGDKGKPKMSMFEIITGDSLGSFKKKTDAYNKGISALYNAQVVTGHKKTGLFGLGKGKDTYSGILEVYPDLIDGENKLNKERAQSILDTQKMSDKTRALLQSLLDLQNQADEAYKEMQSVLQETFGVLGNDLSNSIVDAFVNGADAAESFRQSVGNILEDLAKQIMYSLFLKGKFDKLQKDLEGIYATEGISDKQIGSEVTKLLGGFFSGIGSTIDESTKFLEEFQKQAKESGFDIFQGEAGKGLSDGIKSITEDTAQLIASYLNAIRGSVLLQELYMKNIDLNVAGIYQAMGGSPDITTINTIPPEIIAAISEPFRINNDFLRSIDINIGNMHSIAANCQAQLVMIQANTFNNANTTMKILDRLDSVIAAWPKGGYAIKAWM